MRHTQALLGDVVAATDRLIARAQRLSDSDVRTPVALPGWTRGHVLSHLARNADGLCNLIAWARTGEQIPMYVSDARRDADIEAGAGRGAAELLDDLRTSAEKFVTAVRELPAERLSFSLEARHGLAIPAWSTLTLREREVELHHVDLDVGYAPADWPEDFTESTLDWTANRFGERDELPLAVVRATDTGREWRFPAAPQGPVVSGTSRDLLAWLSGRSDGQRLTVLPPGPLPQPPPWP